MLNKLCISLLLAVSALQSSGLVNHTDHNMKFGDKFIMDAGDGDQSFFQHHHILEYVEADWFPKEIARGRAFVFEIKNGTFAGRYIALTSRVLGGIPEQIYQRQYASVVVHLLPEEHGEYDEHYLGNAIGMSFIDSTNRHSERLR